MLKKFFSREIGSISAAALVIGFFSVLSRLLGVFRDRILAGEFGAGDVLDAYYAAFKVPDLVFSLFVLGALSAGFVPVFTKLIADFRETEKNDKAWNLASKIFNLVGIFLVAVSILGMIFTPYFIKYIAPGFSPEKTALAAQLTRIMFLSPLFLGFSSIFGGVLQSFKRFFVYSLAPVVYNIGIIVGALYLAPMFGPIGLAWGVALGAFLHFAVQVPLVFRLGFRWRPDFGWRDEGIRKIARMMSARTMTLAVSQFNLTAVTIIASTLASGSLTVFNLANNLASFPVGLFGLSFAIAAFPSLSATGRKEMAERLSFTLRQILFFIIPSSALLLALRAQIVRVVLGSGNFSWADTIATIDAVGFFTIGLFAQALVPLLIRGFYALQDSRTPFYIGLVSATANIALGLFLPRITFCNQIIGEGGMIVKQCLPLAVSGLALAFSVSSIINLVLLWLALKKRLSGFGGSAVLKSALKLAAAAIFCSLAAQGAKIAISPWIDMNKFLGVFLQGLSAGLVGILTYLIFCRLLKSEEFFGFWQSLKSKLLFRSVKKVQVGDSGEARGI